MPSTPTIRVLILCSLLSIAGCSGKPKGAGKAPPALPVAILEAEPTRAPSLIEVVGQAEGAKDAEVRARVGGILQKTLYHEGDRVREGQPMFLIDPAPYEIAANQARAQLAEQKAKLEQANREAARLKKLVATGAVSQKEYDDSVTNAAVAQAALAAAEASSRQAELNLSYTTVTAPVSGISGRSVRSDGSLISVNDSLLTTVVQSNPIWVRFALAQSDLEKLPGGRLGPKAIKAIELVRSDGSVYPVAGKLNFTASTIDPKLGTVELRAEFENKDALVLPGEFVRVKLVTGIREGVYLVPQTAVLQSEMGNFVFLMSPKGTAEIRPVKAGEWQGKNWVILDGLKPGDKVIVNNLIKVRPDAPVVLQPSPGPKGSRP